MVRRCNADRLVAAMALSLSAGRVSLRAAARRRTRGATQREREFELIDTGMFDGEPLLADRRPNTPRRRRDDMCVRIRVRNAGPEAAELHVLPTLWFRNRWSWELGAARRRCAPRRNGRRKRDRRRRALGRWLLVAGPGPAGEPPQLLFCENETNSARLFGGTGANAVSEGRHQRSRRCRRAPR